MNIKEFRDKVKNRILSQYLSYVRETKLNKRHYLAVWGRVALFTLTGIIWIGSFYLLIALPFHERNVLLFFPCMVSAVVSIFHTINFISYVRALKNLRKESDKHFKTVMTDIPLLDSNEELSYYIYLNHNSFFNKQVNFQEEGIDLVSFTKEELNEFKNLALNETQSQTLLCQIDKGFTFDMLEELLPMDNEVRKSKGQDYLEIINNLVKGKYIELTPEKFKLKLKEML